MDFMGCLNCDLAVMNPSVKNGRGKKTEKLKCNLTFIREMIGRDLAKDVRTGVPVSLFSGFPIPS